MQLMDILETLIDKEKISTVEFTRIMYEYIKRRFKRMNTLIQHAKLAIRMNNNGINREFIKKFPIEEIIDCCNRIEQNKILNDEYKDNEVIQEEIIKDEKFIHYLNIAYKKDLDMVGFEELLIAIKQHNEKMTDYSIKDILNVLYNKELFYKSYYDYLKYFRNESISLKKELQII